MDNEIIGVDLCYVCDGTRKVIQHRKECKKGVYCTKECIEVDCEECGGTGYVEWEQDSPRLDNRTEE